MGLESTIQEIESLEKNARTAVRDALLAKDVYCAVPFIKTYLSCAISSREKGKDLPEEHPLRDRYLPESIEKIIFMKMYEMTGPDKKSISAIYEEGTPSHIPLGDHLKETNTSLQALGLAILDKDAITRGVLKEHAKHLAHEYEQKVARVKEKLQNKRSYALRSIQLLHRAMEAYIDFDTEHDLQGAVPDEAAFPLNYGLTFMDQITSHPEDGQSIIKLYADVHKAVLAYAGIFPSLEGEKMTEIIQGFDENVLAHELRLLAHFADPDKYQAAMTDASLSMYQQISPLLRSLARSPEAISELDRIESAYAGIIAGKTQEFLDKQDVLYEAAVVAAKSADEEKKNAALKEFMDFSQKYACILEEDEQGLRAVQEEITTTYAIAYHEQNKAMD